MKKFKICVYAICKNEEKFVDSWVKSMSEADLIVVTDTGSTDGTIEKLRSYKKIIVFEENIHPWRFDIARNVSLSHVPQDINICVCTDLDERFVPGWRNQLELAWNNSNKKNTIKTGRYIYNWSLKSNGMPDIQFHYFKVHERLGFKWKCPIHEYIQYIGTAPLETVFVEGMVLNHYPDPSKSRSSYLPLLELAVDEDPQGSRMRYYLGREYMYAAQWGNCIKTLNEYLRMPSSTWKDERCAAMRWIARSYQQLGDMSNAYCSYFKAIAEQPNMRDAFIEFARLCMSLKDWSMTYFLSKEALKITERSKTFVNMGYSWDYTPDDICAISAFYMGLPDEAKIHAKAALKFDSTNERLINNLRLCSK